MNWVLRGNDKKGLWQGACLALNSDLPFRHRFEQGALGTRGSPVNFICQQQLRKDRPRVKIKTTIIGVEYRNTQNIRWQEITGKLHPLPG